MHVDTQRQTLYAGAADAAIRSWRLSGTELPPLEGHSGGVVGVSVLPSRLVASASEDGTVRVWAPHAGSNLAVIRAADSLTTMVVKPDGTEVIVGSREGELSSWRLEIGTDFGRVRRNIECRVPFVLEGRRLIRGTRKGCASELAPKEDR